MKHDFHFSPSSCLYQVHYGLCFQVTFILHSAVFKKSRKAFHTRTLTKNKRYTSHSSWFILVNILYVLCFTRSTRALTILQSPGCVIETRWPTVTLVQPMGIHHASSLSKTCFHTCSQTCKVKASHLSAALTVRQRGHRSASVAVQPCGHPKQNHCSAIAIATHRLAVIICQAHLQRGLKTASLLVVSYKRRAH